MAETELVEHKGYITKVGTNQATVRIVSESACASCHAKGACTAADKEEKDIDVYTAGFSDLKIGQLVVLQGNKSLGLKASLYAYILPFFLVIITLFTCYGITKNEGLSGVISLLILVPYFLVLKHFTPKFKKTFTFTLKKIIQ